MKIGMIYNEPLYGKRLYSLRERRIEHETTKSIHVSVWFVFFFDISRVLNHAYKDFHRK